MVGLEALLDHSRFLEILALELLDDPSIADDLAQEVRLTAIRSRPQRVVSWSRWLRTIAIRRAANQRRESKRRKRRELLGARPEAVPAPEDILEREELRRRVLANLLELGAPYTPTLVLRYYEDLTPKQIATRLGISIETVKTRLRRGLELLRTRLDDDFGDRRAWAVPIAAKLAHSSVPLAGGMAVIMSTKLIFFAIAIVVLSVWFLLPTHRESPRVNDLASNAGESTLESTSSDEVEEERERTAVPSPVNAALSGTVLDRSSRTPIENAQVSIRFASGPPSRTATDRAGVFTLVHDTERSATTLAIRAAGYVPRDIDWEWQAAQTKSPIGTFSMQSGMSVSGFVHTENGTPVVGAKVVQLIQPHLYIDSRGPTAFGRSVQESAVLWTDERGRFASAIRGGDDAFVVFAQGCTPATTRSMESYRGEVDIRVRKGSDSIGKVLDASGAPIADARVAFHPILPGFTESLTEALCMTRADGVAVFPGWSGLAGQVVVTTPDQRTGIADVSFDEPTWTIVIGSESKSWQVSDDGGRALANVAATLAPGDHVVLTDGDGRLEFAAPPENSPWIARFDGYAATRLPLDGGRVQLERGASLSVYVTDDTGTPIPDARIAVEDANRHWDLQTMETRERGVAEFDGLPASESLTVTADCSGYGIHRSVVATRSGESTTHTIELHSSSTLTGRVLRPDGSPLVRARVAAQGELRLPVKTWTDEAGDFVLRDVATGDTDWGIRGDEYYLDGTAPVPDGGRCDLGIVHAKRGLCLRGRVLQAQTGGIPDAEVVVGSSHPLGLVIVAQPSDGDGRFEVSGIPPGSILAEAKAPNRKWFEHAELQLERDTEHDFIFDRFDWTSRLSYAGGDPASHLDVSLRWEQQKIGNSSIYSGESQTSDENGDFTMRDLPRHAFRLQVSANTRQPIYQCEFEDPSALPETIVVPRPNRLEITVVALDGATPPRHIDYWLVRRSAQRGTLQFENGNASLVGVAPGRYRLFLWPEHWSSAAVDIDVSEGTTTVEVSLEQRDDLVSVSVTSTSGEAIRGATVRPSTLSLISNARHRWRDATANDDGRVSIKGLELADTLTVSADGYATRIVDNPFRQIQSGALAVVLDPSSELEVLVRDAQGRWADGLEIGYHGTSAGLPMELTMGTRRSSCPKPVTAGGRATIRNLVSGTYQIVVERNGKTLATRTVAVDGPRESIEIDLEELPTLSGVIRIAKEIVSGGQVRIGRETYPVTADGGFTVQVQPGLVRLVYSAPSRTLGKNELTRTLIVTESKAVAIDFDYGDLSLRLVDPMGRPVTALKVAIQGVGELVTDQRGLITCQHALSGWQYVSLTPGQPYVLSTHRVFVQATAIAEIVVTPGRAVRFDFVLAASERGFRPRLARRFADGRLVSLQRANRDNSAYWIPEEPCTLVASTSTHASVVFDIDGRNPTEPVRVELLQHGATLTILCAHSGSLRLESLSGDIPLALRHLRWVQSSLSVALPAGRYQIQQEGVENSKDIELHEGERAQLILE